MYQRKKKETQNKYIRNFKISGLHRYDANLCNNIHPPCPIRSDRQTTSLTLTTGAPYSCTNGRGCEPHEYALSRHRFTDCSVEVTLRSDCLGCLNWPGRRGGGSELIAHIRDIQESAGSRQLDR